MVLMALFFQIPLTGNNKGEAKKKKQKRGDMRERVHKDPTG